MRTAVWLIPLLASWLVTSPRAEAQAMDPAVLKTLGPQVGQPVPAFSLADQAGRTRTLQSVLGPKGAMLVFFRSADW